MRRPGSSAVAALMTAAAVAGCRDDRADAPGCPAVAPPADGGRLAVASDPDGTFAFDGDDADIFLINLDGSGRRRLTRARGNDFSPAWTPDGRRIAFRSNRDRTDELYVVCADGSHERRLTTTQDLYERSPAWSPDGRWLAFAGETRDGVLDVYVMRSDGTGRRNLTTGLDCGAEYPSWSPDGRRIAIHCFAGESPELHVIDAGGERPRRLGAGGFPAWSPDGRTILYDGDDGDVHAIDPDGGRRGRLTRSPATDAFASWSPDGSRIAFASDRGRKPRDFQIYVMSADGSAVRRVTRGRASHFTPAWQPGARPPPG